MTTASSLDPGLLDQQSINTVRFLAVDAVQKAKSGHPGLPDRIGVSYGMADSRIGVARLIVPEHLPSGAPADSDGPKARGQE